jgi:hypothetical protein
MCVCACVRVFQPKCIGRENFPFLCRSIYVRETVRLKFQSIKCTIAMTSFNVIRLDLTRGIYSKNIPIFMNAR